MVDNLPPSFAVVTQSWNLNFLEPSGSLQAYNESALPLPLPLPVLTKHDSYLFKAVHVIL